MRILITGSRALIAPCIIRNLSSYGHEIITADSSCFGAGNACNKKIKHFRIPSCRFKTEAFLCAIKEIVRSERIDLILPLAEDGYYLAKHKETLPCDCYVGEIETVELLHNKWTFYQLCCELGIKTPHTQIATKAEPNKIYKRICSRCSESTTLNPKKVNFQSGSWLMQDKIDGTPISSFSVGDMTIVYGAKFFNKYSSFSNLSVITDENINDKVKIITEKIRNATKYNGAFGLDFVLGECGELYCIECNPRITGGLLLARNYNILDVLAGEIGDIKAENCKFIGHMFWQFWSGEVNFKNAKDYLYAMKHFKEMVFDIHDIKPFLASYLLNFEWIWIALNNKINIKEATSYDLQYNQGN